MVRPPDKAAPLGAAAAKRTRLRAGVGHRLEVHARVGPLRDVQASMKTPSNPTDARASALLQSRQSGHAGDRVTSFGARITACSGGSMPPRVASSALLTHPQCRSARPPTQARNSPISAPMETGRRLCPGVDMEVFYLWVRTRVRCLAAKAANRLPRCAAVSAAAAARVCDVTGVSIE